MLQAILCAHIFDVAGKRIDWRIIAKSLIRALLKPEGRFI
jgi:hypothetical protein